MFADLIVIASCPRQADPSGLYLSQVTQHFLQQRNTICVTRAIVFLQMRVCVQRSVAVETYLRLPIDRTSTSDESLPSPGLSG